MAVVPTILLLSIQPKYVEQIFSGSKEVELRRTRPRIREGDLVIVYASSPKKALIGLFEVRRVVKKPLEELWEEVKEVAGISYNEFSSYYRGLEVGCGIFLDRTQCFPQPIKLEQLREEWNNFRPPQSFRYLKQGEINFLENMTKFNIGKFAKVYQTTLSVI